MAGEELTNLHLSKQAKVNQLHEEVREFWQAPADQQRFLCGAHILEKDEFLRTFTGNDGVVEVQLLRLAPATEADGM
eukprot:1979407-Amphidinium_carterae.1